MSANPWMTNAEQTRSGWGLFFGLGLVLLLLGMIGLACPLTFTTGLVFVTGFLVLIGGVAQTAHAFLAMRWSGFLLELLIGILDIVVGVFMITRPEKAALVLTLLLAAWFIAGGVFRIVAAASIRFPNWGWTVFGGVVTAALGVLILSEWPESGEFFIGLYVGISLFFQGVAWIMLALSLRSLPPAPVS